MTVPLRAKRNHKLLSPRRERQDREPTIRVRRLSGDAAAAEAGAPATRPKRPPRLTPPAPQDRATYSCGCGMVFDDDVSTSVACPHCGDTQAW
jgi:hypothetical protein